MILRIVLVVIAVFFVLSFFERTFSPDAARRAAMRKLAWRIAVRKTAFTLGSAAFVAVAGFAAWHALRFSDHNAGVLAAVTAPLALLLAVLAYRTGRH